MASINSGFQPEFRPTSHLSNETGLLQSQRLKNYNTLFLEAPEKLAAIESLHVLISTPRKKVSQLALDKTVF